MMNSTSQFRTQIDALDEQYVQQSVSQTQLIEKTAQLLFNEPQELFVENVSYVREKMGRPGHALAKGSEAISVDPETRGLIFEIMDAWSSHHTQTLFKDAGNQEELVYSKHEQQGYARDKYVAINPNPSFEAVQALVAQYQKLPVDDSAESLRAIVKQQRLLFSVVGTLALAMPKEHRQVAFENIENALEAKVNRVLWRFANHHWRETVQGPRQDRFDIDIKLSIQLANAFHSYAKDSSEPERYWNLTNRENFGKIMSGLDRFQPILVTTPQTEVAPQPEAVASASRKPKGPR